MDIKTLQEKAQEDIMRLFGLEHVNIHVQTFLKDIIAQSYEAGRKAERDEILEELLDMARPYDGASWFNQVSAHNIMNIINARNEKPHN
jgi:hypothetical protein